jgi:hypothetical protein
MIDGLGFAANVQNDAQKANVLGRGGWRRRCAPSVWWTQRAVMGWEGELGKLAAVVAARKTGGQS